ncbi:response regulator [Actinokineospora auranticolor]|uniref:Response regulator receiver domain-containing protein n=1 Tax=Actinokineospora auranticolor TaxID=155976 RepID=A0A2S6GJT5_9PSEU|nr:response regulator [Actinokineospora auranticolor]PPK65463.1 response regulator receiver domain-containing protein [Actinokineospora auranticolor]
MARVLVVDDDEDVRDLVARWLRADGHDVLAVDGGALALAAIERHGLPQVAVLDVDMPGMDGVDLLRQLRRADRYLPALFITVLWSGLDLARMRDAGAAYLPKPFTGMGLCAAVRRLAPDNRGPARDVTR